MRVISKACAVALVAAAVLVGGGCGESRFDTVLRGRTRAFTDIGKERGWSPVTRAQFEAQLTPSGALLVGNPDEVIEKIGEYNEALGGISRITFMMNAASSPHEKLMSAIELIGTRVAPGVNQGSAAESNLPVRSIP